MGRYVQNSPPPQPLPHVGQCGKRGYLTESSARKALHSTQKHKRSGRNEKRYYKCPICRRYHLTSREEY